ncbi:hypothetical protein D8S78_13310 [Natrialba swarupiae]|nr:hypothetical protein [Natrialba swarupiae]
MLSRRANSRRSKFSPREYAQEFSDSDAETRLHAEMNALGLQSSDDPNVLVTLEDPDEEAEWHGETGSLYVSWDWSRLSEWEFEHDSDAEAVEIDADSYMEESVYSFNFEEETEEIPADDLIEDGDMYRFEFDDPEDEYGALESVELDGVGSLVVYPDRNNRR